MEVILGLLTSTFSRYLLKSYLSHTVETGEEVISQLPMPSIDIDTAGRIRKLIAQIISKQKDDPEYSYHQQEQRDLDAEIYRIFGLLPNEIREIELWFCRRYPKLAKSQGMSDEVAVKYADHLIRCARILEKPPFYWRSHPILALIAQGEGPQLEFKEALEVDLVTGNRQPSAIQKVIKTIDAFLNTNGGTLLIGISDAGEIKGLEKDYAFVNRNNADGFEQKIRNILSTKLSPFPVGMIDIHISEFPEGTVCQIDVRPSKDVVHYENSIYIRDGNGSRKLEGRDLTDWIRTRIAS